MLQPAPFQTIERRTISEQVSDQLLDLISSGQLKPGDRLPSERELASQLDVGRTSVREALRHLTMIGLLEAKPGSGTHVSRDVRNRVFEQIGWSLYLNADEVEDLFAIRRALETLAAQLAACNATCNEIEDIAVYRKLGEINERDIEHETEIDFAFHHAIMQASHNVFLIQLMTSIQSLLRKYIQRSIEMRATTRTTHSEHDAIFRAIEDRDSERAGRAMEHHLSISHRRIMAQIHNRM